MHEILIVAADGYPFTGSPSSRSSALPGLAALARFGNARALGTDWRRSICARLGRPDLAASSLASIAAQAAPAEGGAEPAAGTPWIATPVHVLLTRYGAHLPADGVLQLGDAESRTLAASFNQEFGASGFVLRTLHGGFLAQLPALEARTFDPSRCIGLDVAPHLPQGPGGPALRRIGSEIELWLHEHPVNRERGKARAPLVSTLWLWGGIDPDGEGHLASKGARERLPVAARLDAPSKDGEGNGPVRLFARDPVMSGLAALQNIELCEPPRGLEALRTSDAALRAAAAEGTLDVVVLSVQGDLGAFDASWIIPALDALRDGGAGRVTVVANDRSVALRRRDLLKRWRRSRDALAVWQ